MDLTRIPNLEVDWPERYERIRRVNARLDPRGMTRPPRDPDERRFLAAAGQLSPFTASGIVGLGVALDVPEQRDDLL
jgi:hypothetical protein